MIRKTIRKTGGLFSDIGRKRVCGPADAQPLDESGPYFYVPVGTARLFDTAQQKTGCCNAKLRLAGAHGGERRFQEGGKGHIVEADHGNIASGYEPLIP